MPSQTYDAPAIPAFTPPTGAPKFLIFGKNGWIGGMLKEHLTSQGVAFEMADARLEDKVGIIADIERVKPTHVLNCAGVTGRPNVDWCESHKLETIRANVVGTLTLADVTKSYGVHMTNFATGCIFEYDAKHPEGSGVGFTEEEEANFIGSFYSMTKAMVEKLLVNYDNVLTLRLRMPISEDLGSARNFITKIANYAKIVNIPNSMTVLPEMIPYSVELARRCRTGVMNFTNPGVISHGEMMELYKEYIDPSKVWNYFTVEEQAKVIVAPRSNNELDTTKLQAEFPDMLDIKASCIKFVFEPNRKT
mmetsp:Transcript_1119/g.4542  ORF Transcript_1119/g.4542 Transcript_1119/m.4542 type:complete len:306 (+) Transcript_1119:177-1094(+)